MRWVIPGEHLLLCITIAVRTGEECRLMRRKTFTMMTRRHLRYQQRSCRTLNSNRGWSLSGLLQMRVATRIRLLFCRHAALRRPGFCVVHSCCNTLVSFALIHGRLMKKLMNQIKIMSTKTISGSQIPNDVHAKRGKQDASPDW